jgi:hypothetical protein
VSQPIEIKFTGESGDFLSFRVLGRSHPEATDYWDGNWLRIGGIVSLGAFQGNVSGDIRVEELQAFSNSLNHLYETLTGEAIFETLEDWLKIRIWVDKLGQITLSGFVKNGVFDQNRLSFVTYADQTFLSVPIKQIEQAIKQFPLRGDNKSSRQTNTG